MSPCLGSQSSWAGVGPVVLGRAGESGEGGAGAKHSGSALGEAGASAGVERGSEEGGGPRMPAVVSGMGGKEAHTLGITWGKLA